VILALDLGTKTGWAVEQCGVSTSGVWNLKGSRYEGGGMRFLRFRNLLDTLNVDGHGKLGGVERVVYEEVRGHKGVDAAHIYGGLQATLTAWCEAHEIPYEGIPVGTIKKYWSGKGNCNKQTMIEQCHRRGIPVSDDNEADAVALLNYITNPEWKAKA